MKEYLRNSNGLIMVEAIMLIVGAILPILLATTVITNVLSQQNSLALLTRQATRIFALASNNQDGFIKVTNLAIEQTNFDNPVQLRLSCMAQCLPGTSFEVSGKVVTKIIEVPFLPDLEITLQSKAIALLDRFVER